MDAILGFLSQELLLNAALALVHFIWQGALIAVVLWLALCLIPKNSFNWRYRLSVIALVLCVAAPIYTFQHMQTSPADASTVSPAVKTQSSTIESGAGNPERQKSNELISLENKREYSGYLNYILMAWVVGCLLMLFKFVVDLNNTFKLTKKGINPVSNEIEQIAKRLSEGYGLRTTINILKSSRVNVPVVIGWIKPVVLLPIAITIGLEKKHLELIIAHEIAHIKRMDFAVNLLQNIVQIAFFYHPTVYWINKTIRDEREYICDQLALEVLGNDDSAKISLAKALLGTEELREGNLSLVAVAASGGMLKHRISHILDSQYKPATSLKSIVVGFFVFMFSFAALSTTVSLSNGVNAHLSDSISEVGIVKTKQVQILNSAKQQSGRQSSFDEKTSLKSVNNTVNKPLTLDKTESVQESSLQSKSKAVASPVLAIKSTKSTVRPIAKKEISFSPPKVKKTAIDTQTALETEDKQNNNLNIDSKRDRNLSDELHFDLSSKGLTDQFFLPTPVDFDLIEGEPVKVALLDISSANKLKEPKALFTPYPKYPRRAWSRMTNQIIKVDFKIGADGEVSGIKIMENADRDFSREIRRKLKKWRYEPALKNGLAIAHQTSVEFSFEAPQKKKVRLITTGTRIPKR